MTVLAFLLAGLIGVSLGLMGGGGSILTVPVLVYILGFEAKEAIAMSLFVVGSASIVGAVTHWRAGNVALRTAAIFGAVAMASTYLGARLAVLFSGSTQLLMFAAVMLVASVFMFRGPRLETTEDREPNIPLLMAEGAGVGIVAGLVGVGGGFLIVPALVLIARVPIHKAVGTSLVIIAMNSAAGVLGYLGQVDFAWSFMIAFTAVAAVGIILGGHGVRYVQPAHLRRGFAAFLVLMGGFILWQNRTVLLGSHAAPPVTAVETSALPDDGPARARLH